MPSPAEPDRAEPDSADIAPAERGVSHPASVEPESEPESIQAEPGLSPRSPAEPTFSPEDPAEPGSFPQDSAEPTFSPEDPAEPGSFPQDSAEPTFSPEDPAEPGSFPQDSAEPTFSPEDPAEPGSFPQDSAEPTFSPEAPAEPGSFPQDSAEPSYSPEVPAEPVPLEAVSVESDGGDSDAGDAGDVDSTRLRTTSPSWSSGAEADVWSASEVDDAQTGGTAAVDEPRYDDGPNTLEDAWLQDAVHEPIHEQDESPDDPEAIDEVEAAPEPQGAQGEPPSGTAQHDPESGDRWTVVADSADPTDPADPADPTHTDMSADSDDSANADEPAEGEPVGHEAGMDRDPSGPDQQSGTAGPEAAGEPEVPADDAASTRHDLDGAPAFPVPVTMSPKAKKFGWARESLLGGQRADETGTGSVAGKNARTTMRPSLGKIGRGKTPPRVTESEPSTTSAGVPGTTALAAAGSGTGVPATPASATPGAGASGAAEPGHGADRAPESPAPLAESPGSGRADGPAHQVLQVLSPYLRTHRAALLTGAIALLLSVWLLIALPFPLKYAVDAAVASTGADLPALAGVTGNPERALVTSVIVLAVLLILQVIARFTAIAALGRVGVRIATALRSRLLAHVHRLSPGDGGAPTISARNGGQADDATVRPLIDDVAALRDLLSHSGPRAVAAALTLLSLLLVTVIVEPLAALVLLVVGALYVLTATFALRRGRIAERKALTESRMLADTAEELVAATGTIQSYGLESRSERGLTEAGTRAGRALTRARRSETLVHLLTQLIAGIGVVATLLLGGQRVAAGTMTPGDLVLVLADVLITIVVLRELLQHLGSVRSAPAAGDRIAALLAREAGIPEPQRTQPVDQVGGEIVFSAVNTAGGPGGDLFDAVSLVVPAGQHVALLDRAGHESAALISYLLRFDQPDTGRVLLDRFDTRTLSLTDLRRQVAVVQREPVLFTDTVRENIRIGRPDATDAEVAEAARRAGVDDVIAQLSSGFDTVLVRRGNVLTDGQRRRIAIARALLRDAPIVVLDAADADLSTAERQPVLAALAALVQGRTAIVSSRDPETITAMDRVLWFESSDVREDGAPTALAADPSSRLARWLRTQDESV
ncbi:ABC transporter transmembrane domain-containing protein [Brachybacterium sp. FME24]|uniref:ABC transporter transmembrane domain-containing protein n=1 Tax=Brachybacterium sp. FME24 TaxID=2742605 RepID=UPI001867CCC8|nr:ABC transporter transmembrane domain-containing protein [Brachybacterium sp. FME24]